MTTHTKNAGVRYKRTNLLPNTAEFLVATDDEFNIAIVLNGAARFTTHPDDPEKYDRVYECKFNGKVWTDPMTCEPVVAAVDRRHVVKFTENPLTDRIGNLPEGCCFASIFMAARAQERLSPELKFEPLDENTWKAGLDVSSVFRLPQLGSSWPISPSALKTAAVHSAPWELMVTAANVLLNMPREAFPYVAIQTPVPVAAEFQWLVEREMKLRDEMKIRRQSRNIDRTANAIEKMPNAMREALLASLAKRAALQKVEVE